MNLNKSKEVITSTPKTVTRRSNPFRRSPFPTSPSPTYAQPRKHATHGTQKPRNNEELPNHSKGQRKAAVNFLILPFRTRTGSFKVPRNVPTFNQLKKTKKRAPIKKRNKKRTQRFFCFFVFFAFRMRNEATASRSTRKQETKPCRNKNKNATHPDALLLLFMKRPACRPFVR